MKQAIVVIVALFALALSGAMMSCGGGAASAEGSASVSIKVGGAADLKECGDASADKLVVDVKTYYDKVATLYENLKKALDELNAGLKLEVKVDMPDIQAYFEAIVAKMKEKFAGAELKITVNFEASASASASGDAAGSADNGGAAGSAEGEAKAEASASASVTVEFKKPGTEAPAAIDDPEVKAMVSFFTSVKDVVVSVKPMAEEGVALVKTVTEAAAQIKAPACLGVVKKIKEYVATSSDAAKMLMEAPVKWSASMSFSASASGSAATK